MSRTTKGKTWDEIYGKEYANIKRQQVKEVFKNNPSKKGLKWEDIYTPEEVIRRRNRMKNNNPSHNLTEEQKKMKSEKCSIKATGKYKGENNPMFGKHHSQETKDKISLSKQELFSNEEYKKKFKDYWEERKRKYFEENKVIVSCKNCDKIMELLPSHYYIKSKNRYKTFCSTLCQTAYFLTHDHFHYRANGWEQYIINLNIPYLTFTGEHIFWITLHDEKGKPFHKNPDFIIEPFSKTKKVIEVWGKRWHCIEEMLFLQEYYKKEGIDCLLLTNENFTAKNKSSIPSIIERWVNNVK